MNMMEKLTQRISRLKERYNAHQTMPPADVFAMFEDAAALIAAQRVAHESLEKRVKVTEDRLNAINSTRMGL